MSSSLTELSIMRRAASSNTRIFHCTEMGESDWLGGASEEAERRWLTSFWVILRTASMIAGVGGVSI
jgi:hypothetical protein